MEVTAELAVGAKAAAAAYQLCPGWMTHYQALGVEGRLSSWPPGGRPVWPASRNVTRALRAHVNADEVLDFAAFKAWFMKVYASWQANHSVAPTIADVVKAINTEPIWIKPSSAGRKGSKQPVLDEDDVLM